MLHSFLLNFCQPFSLTIPWDIIFLFYDEQFFYLTLNLVKIPMKKLCNSMVSHDCRIFTKMKKKNNYVWVLLNSLIRSQYPLYHKNIANSDTSMKLSRKVLHSVIENETSINSWKC